MTIEKTIEQIDDENVLLVVTIKEEERIRSCRHYQLAKLPSQSAQEVCRLACPEAFTEDAPIQSEGA